jgi:hypothetical protein
MPSNKQSAAPAPQEDLRAPTPDAVETRADDGALSEAISRQAETLLEVADKLASAAQNFSLQREEVQRMRVMQEDIQRVMAQLAQGVESSNAIAARVASGAREAPAARAKEPCTQRTETISAENKEDCDDGDCGCTHPGCCCFDIYLDKIRGLQPQGLLELADSGDTSLPIPTINELEVRLFIALDNAPVGLLLPSLSTTMGVRVPSLLAGGGPGLWMPINQVVGRVCLKKGTMRQVMLNAQGSEVDEGIERPLGFKDEHGEASGFITLDCCTRTIYPPAPIDLYFDHGGVGGAPPGSHTPGAIQLAFYAKRVCC